MATMTVPASPALERVLSIEIARVTERAAVAAARLRGRGAEKKSDQAAVDAMRRELGKLLVDGTVVIGEGEVTMEELLPALREKSGTQLEKVQGIAFVDEHGHTRQTTPRPQIPDIDVQPWPARELVDIRRYMQTWREAHGTGSLSFITARGCPYTCRWCSHQVYGMTHRRRKPHGVVDEVEWLLKTY